MSVLIDGMDMPSDGVYWCEINVAGPIALITIHGNERLTFNLLSIPSSERKVLPDGKTS